MINVSHTWHNKSCNGMSVDLLKVKVQIMGQENIQDH